jgi:putative methyltransferase (TIGR04325 family)
MPALKRLWKGSRAAFGYLIDLELNRRFSAWPGAYRGVFSSFEAARASAPLDRPVGFDHEALTHLYDSRADKVFPSDYPVLFWLERLLPEVSSVFDWGGHIGVSYYAYARYLRFPAGFSWRVGEVPAVVEEGRRVAAQRGAAALRFTADLADGDGADVFLANGSLQFIETPLAESLARYVRLPPHLLVNKLPAYDGETFVTLENTVHAFNPKRVVNRTDFVSSITGAGYELVDSWENPDMSMRLPLHRDRSVPAYSGFYFRARSSF